MSYIGNQPVLNTSEFREEFLVTTVTPQTVFNTGGFTASSDSATLEVMRNGVLLGTADYTLGSDSSTVTLGNAAVSGDIIVIKGRRELTNGVQVTERRHEHTIASGETTVTFPYPLTVSQTDVYFNGVKLGSADFSINSSTRVVSFTTNPAVGDLVAIVSREPALTANSSLPLVDASGNNVLSESGSVVSISSGVQFPAGHIVQTVFNTHAVESVFSSNTPTAVTNLTKSINLKTNNPYIYVILALNSVGKVSSNTSLGIRLTADDSGSLDIKLSDMLGYSNDTQYNFGSGFQAYLHNLTSDSIGSTITYTPKFYSTANSANAIINGNFTGFGQHSQIILMEIKK